MALEDHLSLIAAFVRDGSRDITEADIAEALKLALARYADDTGSAVTVSDAEDTVPAHHREAVACWAAALLLDQLAAGHAGDKESTMQADAVDHGSTSGTYAARAAACRKRYYRITGAAPKPLAPASAVGSMARRRPRIGGRP